MTIQNVNVLYFSPTGTSRKVSETLGAGIGGGEPNVVDVTYPDSTIELQPVQGDVTVVGVPVYAGRVAALAVERLKKLQGNGTPAVAVVLYGNREYEDALLELRNILTEQGFVVVAGCAFIGEHTFSTVEMPIAPGRPDGDDLAKAEEFGRKIAASLSASTDGVQVPGNEPYKDGVKNMPFTPTVDHGACTLCETCVGVCPAGAIRVADEQITMDAELCIMCCACLKNCPEEAISIRAQPILDTRARLHTNCSVRKEPVLFV